MKNAVAIKESYSSRIKKEILKVYCKNKEEMRAEWIFYFSCTAQSVKKKDVDFENHIFPESCICKRKDIMEHVTGLIHESGGDMQIEKKESAQAWIVRLQSSEVFQSDKIFDVFFTEKNLDRIFSDDHLRRAALRGVFLACGSLADPEKSYRLEFVHHSKFLRKQILLLLHAENLIPHVEQRGNRGVFYIKKGEEISNFLALSGAHQALFDFENIRINHELRSKVNRVVNCDSANTRRQAEAGALQIRWLTDLLQNPVSVLLSEELRETAELRVDNPGLSIREIGDLIEPPISKSGVNHRLRRLEMAARDAGILDDSKL